MMKITKSKFFYYLFIGIGFLLAKQEINAEIRIAQGKDFIASVSIMSIQPLELNFGIICKKTIGNLKRKCKVLKEYIFDSDSMNQYNRNLIRKLEEIEDIVVTESECIILYNNVRIEAYNTYYRHVLPGNRGIIRMTPFQQIDVHKQKIFDINQNYTESAIFSLRFNRKDYNFLNLKVKNGDNEDLINWFKDRYVFNERYNLLNSRDVQCNDDIFQAEGEWSNYRANMEITIGDSIDNLGYFNDPSCVVESDVAVHEVSINYTYSGADFQYFNVICSINGTCYINLAENEHFIPQLAFGKNNNFKICLTENEIRFITCNKFDLLVLHSTSNDDDLFY